MRMNNYFGHRDHGKFKNHGHHGGHKHRNHHGKHFFENDSNNNNNNFQQGLPTQQFDNSNSQFTDNYQQQNQIFAQPLNSNPNAMEEEIKSNEIYQQESNSFGNQPNQYHHHNNKPYFGHKHHKDRENFSKDHHHHSHKGGGRGGFKGGFHKHSKNYGNSFPQEPTIDDQTEEHKRDQVTKLEYNDDDAISSYTPTCSSTEIANSLKLTMKLKNNAIKADPTGWQTFPMLVSLTAGNLKSSHRAPVDLVCVIDQSGSMSGHKIGLVKQALELLLNCLNDSDRLSVIVFNDQATRIIKLTRANDQNKSMMLSTIQQIYASGGTDINRGMIHAFHILKSRNYVNPTTSIFLLSDGLDSGAQYKIKHNLAKFDLPTNVTINTFGFGTDHDPILMTDIADLRDGNFYFVEQLEKVADCFLDCLGGIVSSISQDVRITVKAQQSKILKGVEIINAYGNASMWEYQNRGCTTKLINLMSGSQKDYVLKLRIPAFGMLANPIDQVEIVTAEVELVGLDNQPIVKTATLCVDLVNDIGIEMNKQDGDSDVMRNYYRVKGAFLMNKARQLADEKQWIAARKSLQSFKDEVEGSFLREDAFVKNLIDDLGKAIECVNPDIYWKVGKMRMLANQRAQMYQKSNFNSRNSYQNASQIEMLNRLKSFKK